MIGKGGFEAFFSGRINPFADNSDFIDLNGPFRAAKGGAMNGLAGGRTSTREPVSQCRNILRCRPAASADISGSQIRKTGGDFGKLRGCNFILIGFRIEPGIRFDQDRQVRPFANSAANGESARTWNN